MNTDTKTKPNEATRRQISAARPDVSTWLSANAGSGKTRVLTDRVARLLLADTQPQSILCLTYTKAAAAEMQNRLFSRLGEWAMLPDDDLRKALHDMGVDAALDGAILPRARRLFAAAIETPGGLKIQTIHAFCSLILRRFPLEAGVTPGFRELDDRGLQDILETALNDIATQRPDLFAPCAAHVTDADMFGLAKAILGKRSALGATPDRDALAEMLELPVGLNTDMLRAQVFPKGTIADLEKIVPVLAAGSVTDKKMAEKLRPCLTEEDPLRSLAHLESALLTLTGSILKSLGTKKTREALGAFTDALDDLAERTLAGRTMRNGLVALDRHEAFHAFATDLLARVERLKTQRGALDFDDLIERTHALLHRPGVAEWVLYKLDGGISHVLVDEAQDTAPRQWEIIAKLTEDFTAQPVEPGEAPRTVFVVGDFKQSIYSFQGADPERFQDMRDRFAATHEQAGRKLHSAALQHSFRSSAAVLDVVDAVFEHEGTGALGGDVTHVAFKDNLPGRVDLWPVEPKPEAGDTSEWYDPVDAVSEQHERLVLSRKIADEIARIIREERLPTKDGPRPIHAGDFLILVRGRMNGLFDGIISACKAKGIPVAGADRLKLEGELVVQDIIALLKFLDTPEDSLSLAAALRAPLFGLSEDALFRLAAPRANGAHLWPVLRDGTDHREVVEVLQDLLNVSDFLRPYDLIDRILTRHAGRARMVKRMGVEATDGIDAILSRARAFEREHTASLTGFLAWMESGETDIKRQPESAGRALRVMTVHGAKGLESPIVLLPDTANPSLTVKGDLLDGPEGSVVWKGRKAEFLPLTEVLIEEAKEAQAREALRLLYVAMTRAENWLIVCGAGNAEKDESWHAQVMDALMRLDTPVLQTPTGDGRRHARFDWPVVGSATTAVTEQDTPQTPPALPDWSLERAAPPKTTTRETMRASDLPGAKALPGEGLPVEEAKERGTLIHRLLEDLPHIPAADRPDLARAILRSAAPALSDSAIDDLADHALRTLAEPAFADLFSAATLAEVPVSADMPDGRRLHGIIDRLSVTSDHIHAIDYKTNRALPAQPVDIPTGILAQMGAYAVALEQIYPGRAIQLSILWTQAPSLMDVPVALAKAALTRDAP